MNELLRGILTKKVFCENEGKWPVRRLLMSALGILLIGICIGVLQATRMGTDPFNVMMSGIMLLTGLRYSILCLIMNGLMLAIMFLFGRKHIGAGTMIILLGIGFVTEATALTLTPVLSALPLIGRIGVTMIGLLVLCFGIALCIVSKLGLAPYDAMYLILSEKNRLSIRICRFGLDLVCGLAGLLLGGTAGVATLMSVLCLGPAIELFVKLLARPARKVGDAERTFEIADSKRDRQKVSQP